ncbi:hypothetical protein [Scytonema sp. NUACC26]|uniref:hypothetical protein n=1 Tax=Scytonema sp. NUACC26 TaxID=3140176 RepID=UPI0034DC62DC
MTCTITNNNHIRNLYIECQQTICTQYGVPELFTTTINSINYLILPVDSTEYSRVETEKTDIVDTFNNPFISPKLVRVGFRAKVANNLWSIHQTLKFLAISSIASGYNRFIPVTVLDYCHPEITDTTHTVRKGMLKVSSASGTSGVSQNGAPLYTNEYDIEFVELNRRTIM